MEVSSLCAPAVPAGRNRQPRENTQSGGLVRAHARAAGPGRQRPRPTAALVQPQPGSARRQPPASPLPAPGQESAPAGLGRARPARHSPSGSIFLGGAAGGCRGPRVDTRKAAGRVSAEAPSRPLLWWSRGRKRFLQEGARRNTLSSPCSKEGNEGWLELLPLLPAWGGRLQPVRVQLPATPLE